MLAGCPCQRNLAVEESTLSELRLPGDGSAIDHSALDTTVLPDRSIALDLEEPVVTPPSVPRVRHEPVLLFERTLGAPAQDLDRVPTKHLEVHERARVRPALVSEKVLEHKEHPLDRPVGIYLLHHCVDAL